MKRIAVALLACASLFALFDPVSAARAGGWFPRLDPRLAPALVSGAEPVSVWVEFVDKGEQGPGDLVVRLADAERALSPASRARRVHRGVTPLVDYLDLPPSPAYLNALEARGLHAYARSRWLNAVAVRAAGADLAALASLDCVRRVSPAQLAAPRGARPTPVTEAIAPPAPPARDARVRATSADYGLTAGEMARLNVAALHDSGFTGAGVLVCVFDDGFNYYDKHTATRDIDVGGRTRDFVRGGTDVQDTLVSPGNFLHGEWTLSTVGGLAPGIFLGPAYGASYALARTEDNSSEKPIEMVNWLMASEWADSLGADVISSSLGYRTFPDSAGTSLTYADLDGHTSIVTRAAEIAAAKGILVVNSAGNSGAQGTGSLLAPADASGDSTLAVGAVDSSGVVTSFSSRGPTADGRVKPDVMAQGESVIVASAGSSDPDTYTRLGGTSFSCPLTAGVAACLLQARPGWTVPQVVSALKLTASGAGYPNSTYGWGVINALAALHFDTVSVPAGNAPLRFALQSANPMRLNGSPAVFAFGLAPGAVGAVYAVRVYDVSGRLVRTLWSGPLESGNGVGRRARWDGTDDAGHAAGPGLYFVSFESAHRHASIRIAAIR